MIEDFEDATYVFTISSSGGWARSDYWAHTGTWSFKSGLTSDGASSELVITVPTGARSVRFWYRVSSENGFDYLRFRVGAAQQMQASGEVGWTQSEEYPLGAETQIAFTYSKDDSQSSGADAAWIDDVEFAMPVAHLMRRGGGPAASHRSSRW